MHPPRESQRPQITAQRPPSNRQQPPSNRQVTAKKRQFIRVAEKGGSDVRADLGVPFRPKLWPRAGVRAALWGWRIVHGYPWLKTGQHINQLELRAVLNASRWRARSSKLLRTRYVHLVDSQVVAGVLARGRSSSRRLQLLSRRIGAVHLAAFLFPCYGYVDTDDNPADVPSRWRWLRARRSLKT